MLFFNTGVFSMLFFQFVFIEPNSHFLLETKCFASIDDCLGFSALCDSTETSKNISKKFRNFFQILVFYEVLLYPVVEKSGFRVMRIL